MSSKAQQGTSRQCDLCNHWIQTEKYYKNRHSNVMVAQGQCRRHAPTFGYFDQRNRWPCVPSYEWCGEFEAKATTA